MHFAVQLLLSVLTERDVKHLGGSPVRFATIFNGRRISPSGRDFSKMLKGFRSTNTTDFQGNSCYVAAFKKSSPFYLECGCILATLHTLDVMHQFQHIRIKREKVFFIGELYVYVCVCLLFPPSHQSRGDFPSFKL